MVEEEKKNKERGEGKRMDSSIFSEKEKMKDLKETQNSESGFPILITESPLSAKTVGAPHRGFRLVLPGGIIVPILPTGTVQVRDIKLHACFHILSG